MTKRTSAIDTEQAAAHAALAELKQQHAALSLKVSEHPGDTELHNQLDALDNEIATHEKTVQRLTAARGEAKRLDERDERHGKVGGTQTALGNVATLAQSRGDLAVKIGRQFWVLGDLLTEWEQLTEKIKREVLAALAHADTSLTPDRRTAVLYEAGAPYCSGPFARLVAWLCAHSRDLAAHVQVQHIEDTTTLPDAADLAATRLISRIKPEVNRIVKALSRE